MQKINSRFAHLKDLDGDNSPLILAACLTGHDYNNALRVLAGQGYVPARHLSRWDDKAVAAINTGLTEQTRQEIELSAYVLIGEYLAHCGGAEAMRGYLEQIFKCTVELLKRDSTSIYAKAED